MKNKLMIAVTLLLVVLVIGCSPQNQPVDDTVNETNNVGDEVTNDEGTQETNNNGGENTLVNDSSESETTSDVSEGTSVLSQASCSDNNAVSVVVTNNEDKEWNLNELEFRTNGAPEQNPECSEETLASGESTRCTGLDRTILEDRDNIIQLITEQADYTIEVSC